MHAELKLGGSVFGFRNGVRYRVGHVNGFTGSHIPRYAFSIGTKVDDLE